MVGLRNTRRGFLKAVGMGAVAAAMPGFAEAAKMPSSGKLNVLLIFTDDQGTLDVNCYGSTDLHTPNLDALAKRGTRFTQFYVGASVCSPSRAALLTGRCPQRAGLTGNASQKSKGMPSEQVTIAEMLKKEKYRTALFGKWHLGEALEASPNAQGFDEFYGHKVGCIDNYSHFFYWSGPNRHDMWRDNEETWEDEGEFFPDLVVRESHRFLEANKDNPFFLFVPFNMPHYPLQAPTRFRDMYANLDEPRKAYAAFISLLDEKIGEIVDKVDELGLRENTLIIFLSDHGHSTEERNNFGGGNAGPFRGWKFTHWEGGIRVPCIVSLPGRIPENAVRDQVAWSIDWFPTIAHYTGAKLPKRKLDGHNIASLIESPTAPSPHKALHWERGGRWAVREGKWKLVYKGRATGEGDELIPEVEYFLSNLDEDLTETRNIAGKHPDIVKRLKKLHTAWAAEVETQ